MQVCRGLLHASPSLLPPPVIGNVVHEVDGDLDLVGNGEAATVEGAVVGVLLAGLHGPNLLPALKVPNLGQPVPTELSNVTFVELHFYAV